MSSNLLKKITVGDKSVQIHAINDGEGGWILEIEDEFWNSTTWDGRFETADDAFNEAIKAIGDEGIEAFIGAGKNIKH